MDQTIYSLNRYCQNVLCSGRTNLHPNPWNVRDYFPSGIDHGGSVGSFEFCQSDIGESWYFSMVLICISLMNHLEHFLTCLRTTCISLLTNCPYLLPIFLLVCSFPYWFYTLGKLALFCDKLHKPYYFLVCHLYFDFAYGSFGSTDFYFFRFYVIKCIFFYASGFVTNQRKSFLILRS